MDYRELPEDFLEKMKIILGDSYEDYLACFGEEAHHGLRVNTLKISPREFFSLSGWELEQIPWIRNGFYYKEDLKPARHPWYYAGLYYLQEPSAMTPASLLPVEPGERVLDLCAAPGGKSTELAAKLKGKGLLFSNDISSSRARALLKNLELFGAGNICVASETPEKLSRYLEGYFDKILVDAPCSGEGMFRRDSDMVKSYRERGPQYYSDIQKEIAVQAVKMLKDGGMLLYSTCTFDERENEGTIRFLLDTFPELSLVNLEKKEGFGSGIGLTECVRLFPHCIGGEGHFIALLRKKGTLRKESTDRHSQRQSSRYPAEWEPVFDFLKNTKRAWEPERIYAVKEQLYYIPEPFQENPELLKHFRYLRTGLFLGELKKGRFEPSQALAMNLLQEEYSDTVNFSSEDERVLRYLKGETIGLKDDEMKNGGGWCLVCADGYPLGWAKRQSGSLKNKYYPGWRWQ